MQRHTASGPRGHRPSGLFRLQPAPWLARRCLLGWGLVGALTVALNPGSAAAQASRGWQGAAVQAQAQAWLKRWQAGELATLDDATLLSEFKALPTEVLVTAMQLGAGQHQGFEIRMQRQERIDGTWQGKPFLNHIRLRRQPQQVYMAWLSGGPKAGQEILFDARVRSDAMYGHLGGMLGVVSKWIALDGGMARQNSNHTVLNLGPDFVAEVLAKEVTRNATAGRSTRPHEVEVLRVAGQRTVALTWAPGAADPAAYAARTRVCLNLRQPWALQIESWSAAGEIRERILYERVEPKSFTDLDFDPKNPAYRF